MPLDDETRAAIAEAVAAGVEAALAASARPTAAEQVAVIEAQADAQVAVIEAQADAEAELIEARADAEAELIEARAEAEHPDPEPVDELLDDEPDEPHRRTPVHPEADHWFFK